MRLIIHHGIVNETQDGKFNTDNPIKREEIATMVASAAASIAANAHFLLVFTSANLPL